MNKNIVIGFCSWYGNGRTAAAALAKECEERGASVTQVDLLAGGAAPPEWDAAVIVAPIRAGMIARAARQFSRSITRHRGAAVAIVITHAAPFDHFFSPTKPTGRLLARLRRRKAHVLTDPVFLQVQTQEGPLPEDYTDHIAKLAVTLTS